MLSIARIQSYAEVQASASPDICIHLGEYSRNNLGKGKDTLLAHSKVIVTETVLHVITRVMCIHRTCPRTMLRYVLMFYHGASRVVASIRDLGVDGMGYSTQGVDSLPVTNATVSLITHRIPDKPQQVRVEMKYAYQHPFVSVLVTGSIGYFAGLITSPGLRYSHNLTSISKNLN
jgi:hypothetical protein